MLTEGDRRLALHPAPRVDWGEVSEILINFAVVKMRVRIRSVFRAAVVVAMLGVATPMAAEVGVHASDTFAGSQSGRERGELRDREEAPEVSVSGLTITVTTRKPVEVSVYSLLGQLVGHTQAQVGTTRISVPSHGIYIVKAGERTFKLSL